MIIAINLKIFLITGFFKEIVLDILLNRRSRIQAYHCQTSLEMRIMQHPRINIKDVWVCLQQKGETFIVILLERKR